MTSICKNHENFETSFNNTKKSPKFQSPKIEEKNFFFCYYPLSIYRSTRLDVLIKNIYGFDRFGLNLNELLGVKVYKNSTFP